MTEPYPVKDLYLGARTKSFNIATWPVNWQLCGYEVLTLVDESPLSLFINMDFDMKTRVLKFDEIFENSAPSCPIQNYTLKESETNEDGVGLLPSKLERNFYLTETELVI